jgi:hypothetical protein
MASTENSKVKIPARPCAGLSNSANSITLFQLCPQCGHN